MSVCHELTISPFVQAEIYLNLLEDGDDSLPSRCMSMPNEMERRVRTPPTGEVKPDGLSGCPDLRLGATSSESTVDLAKILDPFEQLERECNSTEVREYCVMSGDSAGEDQKVVKSDSDEGVVADDEGGDLVLARYVRGRDNK